MGGSGEDVEEGGGRQVGCRDAQRGLGQVTCITDTHRLLSSDFPDVLSLWAR